MPRLKTGPDPDRQAQKDRLARARNAAERGLSQKEFADEEGISHVAVYNWLKNQGEEGVEIQQELTRSGKSPLTSAKRAMYYCAMIGFRKQVQAAEYLEITTSAISQFRKRNIEDTPEEALLTLLIDKPAMIPQISQLARSGDFPLGQQISAVIDEVHEILNE